MYQTGGVVYVGEGMCKEQGDIMAVQAWDTRWYVHIYSTKYIKQLLYNNYIHFVVINQNVFLACD